MLSHLGRLILLILLLPLFIILIGPFLVLAALRGQQPMGPITLNALRYGPAGRVGGLLLGLVAWVVVWGGLAWIIVNGFLPTSTVANAVVEATPTTSPPTATATMTLTPLPPTATATDTPTATPTAPTLTPTPILTLTITAVFEATPSRTATPTMTPTLDTTPTLTATATPTATPTPTATATPPASPSPSTVQATQGSALDLVETTVRPTPQPLLSDADQEAVIETIREGNELLWLAISVPGEGSFRNLERLWQDDALEQAQTFATERSERYGQPSEVQFRYMIPPRISDQSGFDQVIILSREAWTYNNGQPAQAQETLDFTYTLQRADDGWLITGYSYRAEDEAE